MKLLVVHAVNNKVFCGLANHPLSCDDMEAVDRQLAAAYELQYYVDSLSGGPGRGWHRIVQSGREARQGINNGKLAVGRGVAVDGRVDRGPGGPHAAPA